MSSSDVYDSSRCKKLKTALPAGQTDESGLLVSNNACGYRGVFRYGGKFEARLKVDQKQICFGVYETAKEAAEVATEQYNLNPTALRERAEAVLKQKTAQDTAEESVRKANPIVVLWHCECDMCARWHSRCQSTACLIQRTP